MKAVQTKSVKLNMIMNAILTMSAFIFPLITFPYVSRVLLPVGTGKVSFATSVVSYFSMFAQLGIPTYGIRACAKVREDREQLTRTVQEIMLINLVMCVIVYAAFSLCLLFVPRLQQDRPLFIIISLTILLNALGVEWLYKGLEQYSYITIRSIAFKFVALIALFLLVHQQSDYVIYGGITILASSASNIMNFFHLRHYISMRPVGNYHIKKHLKMVVVFFAMSIATTIYTHLDTVMLGFMKTDADVGYYSAAVKIKTILVSIVTSASSVLLPRMTSYVESGKKEAFFKIAKKTMNLIFLVAVPFTVYFVLYAKEGVYFLSGDAYAGAIVPMQIIMPTLLLIGMSNLMGIQIMVPIGKELQVLYSEIAGAIVDLVINIALIPKYGAAGAAIGTLVAEAVVLLFQIFTIRDVAVPLLKAVRYKELIVSIVLAGAASIWVKKLALSSFFTLAISACIFFGVYLVVELLFKESLILELVEQTLGKLRRKKD
jgi:O-antigen/teichoic acid export membrane protein